MVPPVGRLEGEERSRWEWRCTCSKWTLKIQSLTHERNIQHTQRAHTHTYTQRAQRETRWITERETNPKCDPLTYLLSFFSGGDFLSQPWKRISPPLMFVSARRFFWSYSRLRLSLVHDCSPEGSPVQSAVGVVWLSLAQSAPPI